MITIQDRYIGVTKLEKALQCVNYDKRTPITAADIAQFIDEYYPEFFENIASDDSAYSVFNYRIEKMMYHSFAEIAADILADMDMCLTGLKFKWEYIAYIYGYSSLEEMDSDYSVICDNAIDGFLVIPR